jgi:hypothetical protein
LKASFEVTDAYILTIQEVVNNKDMDMHSMDNVEDFLGTIMKVYETSKEATYRASLFSTSYITRAKRATDDY